MKINVFGFGNGDYVSKQTGELIEGKKLYYGYKDPERKDLVGMACGYIFVKKSVAEKTDFHGLMNSQLCEANYNQFGLTSIVPCLPEDAILKEAV